MTQHLIIAGLGNPGPEYEKTRHNLGADLLEVLSGVPLSSFKEHQKSQCLVFVETDGLLKVHYVFPQGYMNLSGSCLIRYAQYFKISVSDLLVCYDDLSLPCGDFRLKLSGGHGGHKGMQDCLLHFKTDKIARLRLGIDHPGSKAAVQSYVLKRFTYEQEQANGEAFEKITHHKTLILEKKWSEFQNKLH